MTGPGGALIATILFIPLSAAQFNLEADWAEAGMQVILRHCPICSQDAIVGHGRRRKQAHDQHHDWIGIRRGLCSRCGKTFTFLPPFSPPYGHYGFIARSHALQRRFLEGCSWEAAAPTVKDPDRVADLSTLRRWCTSLDSFSAVFLPAQGDPGCRRVAHQNRDSRARFAPLALAHRVPVSRPVLALADWAVDPVGDGRGGRSAPQRAKCNRS
jgi:hypothetical protein